MGISLPIAKLTGIGAIIGDIVGSPYEFSPWRVSEKDFPLFSGKSHFTDDTVMTLAVGVALAQNRGKPRDEIRHALVQSMLHYGRLYPNAGYGARFFHWLHEPKPYGSYGNGSAMRVSPVAWLCDSLEEVLEYAALSAEVSHNHPEGVKGAQAIASAIFLTRMGASKKDLAAYITQKFAYDLKASFTDIKASGTNAISCQETAPQAIIVYLASESFEDALRKAVSLGGDTDTIAAMAASIAEARYSAPEAIVAQALGYLPEPLLKALQIYEAAIKPL